MPTPRERAARDAVRRDALAVAREWFDLRTRPIVTLALRWRTRREALRQHVRGLLEDVVEADGNCFWFWWSVWCVARFGGDAPTTAYTKRTVAAVCSAWRKIHCVDEPDSTTAAHLLVRLRHMLCDAAIEWPETDGEVMDPPGVARGSFRRPARSLLDALNASGAASSDVVEQLVYRVVRAVAAAMPLKCSAYTVILVEGLTGDAELAGRYRRKAPRVEDWTDDWPAILDDSSPAGRYDLLTTLEHSLLLNNREGGTLGAGIPSPGLEEIVTPLSLCHWEFAIPYLSASIRELCVALEQAVSHAGLQALLRNNLVGPDALELTTHLILTIGEWDRQWRLGRQAA